MCEKAMRSENILLNEWTADSLLYSVKIDGTFKAPAVDLHHFIHSECGTAVEFKLYNSNHLY